MLKIEANTVDTNVVKTLKLQFYWFQTRKIIMLFKTLQYICYEKVGDWPNKNRNFTVQN